MTDDTTRCLAATEVLIYLERAMPEGRLAEIDRHLDECRLCEAAVAGVAGLEWREGFLRSTDALLARVRARTAQAVTATRPPRGARRLRPAAQYLTLAAAVALALGAAIFLARPGPGEVLFSSNFEPYPSTQPIVRGDSTAGRRAALALYEAGDYQAALAALEDALMLDPGDPVARFYAGLCRLALGRAREAISDLEQVLRLDAEDLRAPSEWYLALAHLRENDLEGARKRLERIAGVRGFYQGKARALLAELDRVGVRS